MKIFHVQFHGRKSGALGNSYWITAHIPAESAADFPLAIYHAGYERVWGWEFIN